MRHSCKASDVCPGFFGVTKAMRKRAGLSQELVAQLLGYNSANSVHIREKYADRPITIRKLIQHRAEIALWAEAVRAREHELHGLEHVLGCETLQQVGFPRVCEEQCLAKLLIDRSNRV